MIPKVIHYCWFGRGKKPRLAKKCIKSWKKYCPDYQIIEWNEDNYDIASAPLFVRQAIEKEKWAFVSDYARYQVIYQYGGIYLDTDVELIKSLDSLLHNTAYWGFEQNNSYYIASGLGFGAEKGTLILLDLMKLYENISFILPDGSLDMTPCPTREIEVFSRYGLVSNGKEQHLEGGIHIYPCDYLCACNWQNGFVQKTENTISIHWYNASWYSADKRKERYKELRKYRMNNILHCIIHIPNRIGMKILGQNRYTELKKLFGKESNN